MKMLLTRIGKGSKIVITGDLRQHDRGYEQNGLKDFINRYSNHNNISTNTFTNADIERDPIIDFILQMYED